MIPIRNVYYLLCYAWNHLEESDLVDRQALEQLDRVEDLLGKVLAEGVFRLLKRGLDRGYRETTEELAGVRGKIEVGAMATSAVRARGRVICTYEIFTQDILHNQIIRSTLRALLNAPSLNRAVRNDVALAYQRMDGVRTVRLTRQLFSRVQLSRSQRHYKFLLQICHLAHDLLLVDDRSGGFDFHDFRRDQRQMWRLFEDFVREFYRVEQSELRVLLERKIPWGNIEGRTPADTEFIPGMYSDVLLEGSGRRIILDTKFYQKPLDSRYGAERLRSGNLYQLLSYLTSRQLKLPDGPRHEGILLYAAVAESFSINLKINGFKIQAATVDLARPFRDIREQMLTVLDC